jgi:hypothetical protein
VACTVYRTPFYIEFAPNVVATAGTENYTLPAYYKISHVLSSRHNNNTFKKQENIYATAEKSQ